LVVGLIAVAGWVAHAQLGHSAPWGDTVLFAGVGLIGFIVGTWALHRVPQVLMRRSFSVVLALLTIVNVWPLLQRSFFGALS
jgi:uncharacterized membrane protein YfcA